MANETFLNPKISYTLGIERESQDKTFQPNVEISSVKKQDKNEAFVGATVHDVRGKNRETHVVVDQFGNFIPTIGYSVGPVSGNILDDVFVPSTKWTKGTPNWTTIAEVPVEDDEKYFANGGRWLVTFTCRFAPADKNNFFGHNNITGVCGVGITSTEENDEAISFVRRNIVPMLNGHQTYVTATAVIDLPHKKGAIPKLIFKAFQTSGVTLNTANRFTAVRLGDIPKYKNLIPVSDLPFGEGEQFEIGEITKE